MSQKMYLSSRTSFVWKKNTKRYISVTKRIHLVHEFLPFWQLELTTYTSNRIDKDYYLVVGFGNTVRNGIYNETRKYRIIGEKDFLFYSIP